MTCVCPAAFRLKRLKREFLQDKFLRQASHLFRAMATAHTELAAAALRHMSNCQRQAGQAFVKGAKCDVQSSPKHGLGVFATRSIKARELITL